jgi:hypothetical protein
MRSFAVINFHGHLKNSFCCLSGCQRPLRLSQALGLAFYEDQQLPPD